MEARVQQVSEDGERSVDTGVLPDMAVAYKLV